MSPAPSSEIGNRSIENDKNRSTYLEVKPFPSPVDLNVAFRIKGTDAGGRALEVASVDVRNLFSLRSWMSFIRELSVLLRIRNLFFDGDKRVKITV